MQLSPRQFLNTRQRCIPCFHLRIPKQTYSYRHSHWQLDNALTLHVGPYEASFYGYSLLFCLEGITVLKLNNFASEYFWQAFQRWWEVSSAWLWLKNRIYYQDTWDELSLLLTGDIKNGRVFAQHLEHCSLVTMNCKIQCGVVIKDFGKDFRDPDLNACSAMRVCWMLLGRSLLLSLTYLSGLLFWEYNGGEESNIKFFWAPIQRKAGYEYPNKMLPCWFGIGGQQTH